MLLPSNVWCEPCEMTISNTIVANQATRAPWSCNHPDRAAFTHIHTHEHIHGVLCPFFRNCANWICIEKVSEEKKQMHFIHKRTRKKGLARIKKTLQCSLSGDWRQQPASENPERMKNAATSLESSQRHFGNFSASRVAWMYKRHSQFAALFALNENDIRSNACILAMSVRESVRPWKCNRIVWPMQLGTKENKLKKSHSENI